MGPRVWIMVALIAVAVCNFYVHRSILGDLPLNNFIERIRNETRTAILRTEFYIHTLQKRLTAYQDKLEERLEALRFGF